MNLDDAYERSASAGEYVLGTLDAQERASFERALASDAALQAEVYAWQDRLVGLSARVAAAEPEAQLWSRIEAGLGAATPAVASSPAAPMAQRADGAARPAANDPLWQRLRRWQATSALAVAASLVLATLLVLRAPEPQGPMTGERYLALLQAPDKSTGWIVEGSAGGRVRLVPVGDSPPVPAGKTLQFWTKPEGAAGPTSLGLVRVGESVELPPSRLPGLSDKQLFELTLEPEGGSPLDRPTGPILYIGRAVRI